VVEGLVGTTYNLELNIGRIGAVKDLPAGWSEHTAKDGRPYYFHAPTQESTYKRPVNFYSPEAKSILKLPPLAMFSPGGGRAVVPAWFDRDWGRSGEKLSVPLEIEFFEDDFGYVQEEPLKRTQARTCYVRGGSSNLDLRSCGVAWGLVDLGSKSEALLVWCIDLPDGVRKAPDVELPAGTRLYCSTQVWRGALQPPASGVPTMALPGPWPGTVAVGTRGQLAVQRMATGKLVNPFENAGKIPNPFAGVPEFGVVGSFELAQVGGVGRLESNAAQEVEVIVDDDLPTCT